MDEVHRPCQSGLAEERMSRYDRFDDELSSPSTTDDSVDESNVQNIGQDSSSALHTILPLISKLNLNLKSPFEPKTIQTERRYKEHASNMGTQSALRANTHRSTMETMPSHLYHPKRPAKVLYFHKNMRSVDRANRVAPVARIQATVFEPPAYQSFLLSQSTLSKLGGYNALTVHFCHRACISTARCKATQPLHYMDMACIRQRAQEILGGDGGNHHRKHLHLEQNVRHQQPFRRGIGVMCIRPCESHA
uniref:Uncharacterized protein n=1 Tax=Guillardia theta TaxID=55529 RepID=A0A7S4NZJ0_GUITH